MDYVNRSEVPYRQQANHDTCYDHNHNDKVSHHYIKIITCVPTPALMLMKCL